MRNCNEKRKYRHLNQDDRDRIEVMRRSDISQKDMAEILAVDPGTISREIQRKRKDGIYSATTAGHKAGVKRSNSKYQGMKIQQCDELRARIITGLKDGRAPDEIAGRLKEEGFVPTIEAKTIYKWLYSVWGQKYCKYLCTKRYKVKKQKNGSKREMIPDRVSIEHRPSDGIHAEGDLFVSSHNTVSGAVIVVQKTQLILGTLIPNRKPSVMVENVNMMIDGVSITDLTWDNGIENKKHAAFNLPSYFCDPHSPWQKPHVENSIGLLRRWYIPKRTDLCEINEETFQRQLNILNHKWRKSLGYKSAYEASLECGIIQKIPPRYAGDL